MNAVSPFKLTSEDLEGLDRRTSNGLQPLLNALNVFTQQTVQGLNSVSPEQYIPVTLNIGATVADSFPVVFKHGLSTRPRAVLLANIRPRDQNHVLTAAFVMQGWSLTDAGLVSVPWVTGLLASNGYDLTFLIR